MPELPEVQTVVDTLRPVAVGRRVTAVRLLRADVLVPFGFDLPAAAAGRVIAAVDRRGKKIVVALDDGCRFVVHLGMTGRLTVEPATADMAKHTHLVLDLCDGRTVRFRDPRRFGGVWWLGRDGPADAGMGPEPLTLGADGLAQQLARTGRAVKVALLDQRVVAGLGNIYVDESLHAAGIHPTTPARSIEPAAVGRLSRAVKRVLRTAIRHRGSTLRDYADANGERGGFQLLHAVYARGGQPCRACRTAIERIVLGGRSTHFCPRCQPAVTATPA